MVAPIQWRSIDDAPTDGTLVDLFFPDMGRVTDCYFTRNGIIGWARDEWSGRPGRRFMSRRVFLTKPTHFVELLAAPEVA